jgi:hypothetical protein
MRARGGKANGAKIGDGTPVIGGLGSKPRGIKELLRETSPSGSIVRLLPVGTQVSDPTRAGI